VVLSRVEQGLTDPVAGKDEIEAKVSGDFEHADQLQLGIDYADTFIGDNGASPFFEVLLAGIPLDVEDYFFVV